MTSLLYRGPAPFILASRSPRRQEILGRLGVEFAVRPADIDEAEPPGLPPRELAMSIAARKAAAVARGLARGLVLGADTIVVLYLAVLGKPSSPAEARAMLVRLAGRSHVVTTGLALIDAERGTRCLNWEDTTVHMRAASEDEIAAYVATGEPLDKAGAYGIQGFGATIVERVEGDYFSVMGLGLRLLVELLARVGIAYRFSGGVERADG